MASALIDCNLLRELNLLYRIAPSDIVSLRRLSNIRSICLGLASREVIAEMGSWIEQCESFSIRVQLSVWYTYQLAYQLYLGCIRLRFVGYNSALRR